MLRKKVFVLIGETCVVVLGLHGNPYKAFLIVPKAGDVKAAAMEAQPALHNHFGVAQPVETGRLPQTPSTRLTPPIVDKSLQVCVLINGTDRYRDIAVIHAKGDTLQNVEILDQSDIQLLTTTQLYKDFWQDAWLLPVMWVKHQRGVIEEQGVVSGMCTAPPDCNVFGKIYQFGDQGILLLGDKIP